MKLIENIKKSKFLVDFLSTLFSNTSLLLLGLLGSIIRTRILGPDGLGLVAVLTTFTLLFVSLAEMGIRQSTIYYSGKGTYTLDEILSANMIIWIFSSIVGILIFHQIIKTSTIEVDTTLLWVSSMLIPVSIARSFINGLMLGADKISKAAWFNAVNGILSLLMIIIFLWVLEMHVLGAIIAMVIPAIALTSRKLYFLNKALSVKFKFRFDLEIIKKLIGHGILYGLALFLMSNQKKIPILLMAGRVEEYEIGIYSAGYAFAALLYKIFGALAPVIFVKSSKAKDPTENSYKVQKLMRVTLVILLFMCLFLYFAIEFIIPLLYGNKFEESIPITRILFVGVIFYNVFLILNMDMAGRGKPWIAIYALIPVTLINIAANYFFIEIFGNVGAALSTALAMVIATLLYLYFYSRELKISIFEIIKPRKSDWDFIYRLLGKTNPINSNKK